eukprot:tig00000836_g4694.t1
MAAFVGGTVLLPRYGAEPAVPARAVAERPAASDSARDPSRLGFSGSSVLGRRERLQTNSAFLLQHAEPRQFDVACKAGNGGGKKGKKGGFGGSNKWASWAKKKGGSQSNDASSTPKPEVDEAEEVDLESAKAAFPLPVDTSRYEPEIVEVELSDAMKELIGDAPDIERPPPEFKVVDGYEVEAATVPEGAWDTWRSSMQAEPELEPRDPEKEVAFWREAAKDFVVPPEAAPKPAEAASSAPPAAAPKPPKVPKAKAPEPEFRDPKKETDFWRGAARDLVPEEAAPAPKAEAPAPAPKAQGKAKADEASSTPAVDERSAWGAWQAAAENYSKQKPTPRDAKKEVDFWRGAAKSVAPETSASPVPDADDDWIKGVAKDIVSQWKPEESAAPAKPAAPPSRPAPQWVQPDLSFLPKTEDGPADPSSAWASWSEARETWRPEAVGQEMDMAERYERIARGIAGYNAAEAGVDYAKAEGFDDEDNNVYPDEEEAAGEEAVVGDDEEDYMYLADDAAEGAGTIAVDIDAEAIFSAEPSLTNEEKYLKYSTPVEGETDEERKQREAWAAWYKPRNTSFEYRDPKKETAFWKGAARDLVPDAPAAPQEETQADMWRETARDLAPEASAEGSFSYQDDDEDDEAPAPEVLAAQQSGPGEREAPKWVIPEGYEIEGASVPEGAWDSWRQSLDAKPEEEAAFRDPKAEVDMWRGAAREVVSSAPDSPASSSSSQEFRDPKKDTDFWRGAARDLVPGEAAPAPQAEAPAPALKAEAEEQPAAAAPAEYSAPIIVDDAATVNRTSVDSWLSVAREAAGAAGVDAPAAPAGRPAREPPKWVIPEGYEMDGASVPASAFDAWRKADEAWESMELEERDAQAEVDMWRRPGQEAKQAATQSGPAAPAQPPAAAAPAAPAPAQEAPPPRQTRTRGAPGLRTPEGAAPAAPAASEPAAPAASAAAASSGNDDDDDAELDNSAWGRWQEADKAFKESAQAERDPKAEVDQWRDFARSFVPSEASGSGAPAPKAAAPTGLSGSGEPSAAPEDDGSAWGRWREASEAASAAPSAPSAGDGTDLWRGVAREAAAAAPGAASSAPADDGASMWRSFAKDVSNQVAAASSGGAASSSSSSPSGDGADMWRSFARDVASQVDGGGPGAIAPAGRPGALAKGKTPETDAWRAIARAAVGPPAEAPKPYPLPPGVPPPAPAVMLPAPPILSASERSAWDSWNRVKTTPDWALAAKRTDEQSQWLSAARDMSTDPTAPAGYRRLPSTDALEASAQAVDFRGAARNVLSDPAVRDAVELEAAGVTPTLETGKPVVVDPSFSVNKVLDSYKSADASTVLPPRPPSPSPAEAAAAKAADESKAATEEKAEGERKQREQQLTLGAIITGAVALVGTVLAALGSAGQ